MRFEETNHFSPSQLDFVPRERRNQSGKLVAAFGLTIALILLLGYVPMLNSHAYTPIFLAIILAILCFFVVVRNQQTLDLVMTTEHQNLLFTQAVALGTSFCLFVRRNGSIVYANAGVRILFSHGEYQTLDAILEAGQISKPDRERIMGAIYNHIGDRTVVPLQIKTGEIKDYVITVEPLPRPAGYLLLRGREFQGERSGVQLMPDMLRSTSADKLDHLLGSTPIGHFATDAFGRIEYANAALGNALGYAPGEMLEQRLTLCTLLAELDGTALPEDYTLADFTGHATIRARDGASLPCLLFQSVIRDDKGKLTGATGSIVLAGMLES